jgi:hypothetical protein
MSMLRPPDSEAPGDCPESVTSETAQGPRKNQGFPISKVCRKNENDIPRFGLAKPVGHSPYQMLSR